MRIIVTESQLKLLIESSDTIYEKFGDMLRERGWSNPVIKSSIKNTKEDISKGLGEKKSKYESWVVKNLTDYMYERGDTEIIYDLIDLCKEFDSKQNRLTIDNILKSLSGVSGIEGPPKEWSKFVNKIKVAPKDINSYSPELISKILENLPESKREKSKSISKEVVKIYEDENLLVIRPMTKEASCKYGTNTKWCTSGRLDNRFSQHYDGGLLVYYIVKPSVEIPNEKFRKMASFQSVDNRYEYIWYDSKDDVLPLPPTTPYIKLPKNLRDSLKKAITTLEDLYAYGKADYDDYDEWGNTDW